MPNSPYPSDPGSEAQRPALVYGWPGCDLAFAPLEEAQKHVMLRRGEGFPMTWGEFRARFGEQSFDECAAHLLGAADYASFEEFLADFDADAYDCSAEEAYRNLPVGDEGRAPEDSDLAEFSDSDGNIADRPVSILYWPAQLMLDWFPNDLGRRYGREVSTRLDGEYLELDRTKCLEIVAELEARGFTCVEDNDLISAAAGY